MLMPCTSSSGSGGGGGGTTPGLRVVTFVWVGSGCPEACGYLGLAWGLRLCAFPRGPLGGVAWGWLAWRRVAWGWGLGLGCGFVWRWVWPAAVATLGWGW